MLGNSGQSLVELAMFLPLLVALALFVFDLSRAIQANNIIINISREGANLALRTSRDSYSSEQIMNSLASTAQPLVIAEKGMMYITEVKMVGNVLTIPKQEGWSRNSSGSAVNSDHQSRSSGSKTLRRTSASP
jgi:Flp pilus assembly protein TadG